MGKEENFVLKPCGRIFQILFCVNQIYMRKTLFEVFDEVFQGEVKRAKNYPEAYENAADKFEREHGFPAFNGYDSFRKRKGYLKKRKPKL